MLVKYPIMGLSFARGRFAICGGGGSLKSGIKNTVDIYQLSDSDPSGFVKDMSVETGTELASGVAYSHDGSLLAVSVNAACWLYEVDPKAKELTLLVKFRTDFAADESSQSTACFVGNTTLLTGGEDGCVRVWRLSRDPTSADKTAGTAPALHCDDAHTAAPAPGATLVLPRLGDAAVSAASSTLVTLTREYRGHTKRIRAIHVEPSHRNLVVSSSEDLSCHIWRLTEASTGALFKFSKDDALDTAMAMLQRPRLPGVRKHQFRCARFANSGRYLYTVLTPARGDSVLVKWKPATLAQTLDEHWPWVVDAAAIASDKPVASLCVSDDDSFVCTAAVSGDIQVFHTATLQPYRKHSSEQHSFAITGMSFASAPAESTPAGAAAVVYLVSGGADKNLLRHAIPLTGGELVSGTKTLQRRVVRALGASVQLVLGAVLAATLLAALLLWVHAEQALLLTSPLTGFEDALELHVDSPDALAALGATLLSVVMAWIMVKCSSVRATFFANGVACLVAAVVAFYVAASPGLALQWQTGDAVFDELLDYKLSLLFGAASSAFFFVHSVLQLLA